MQKKTLVRSENLLIQEPESGYEVEGVSLVILEPTVLIVREPKNAPAFRSPNAGARYPLRTPRRPAI